MSITNPVAAADIEHVIKEFIQAGKTFTALHVTCELRSRKSPAGILRHMSDISPEVRDTYHRGNMSGYQAMLDRTQTFHIYYPSGTNPHSVNVRISHVPVLKPQEVLPQGISSKRVSSGTSTGYPTISTPPGHRRQDQAPPKRTRTSKYLRKVVNGTTAVRGWRKGGYVETPREMLRKAGLTCGTVVLVAKNTNGDITIEASSNGNAQVQYSRHCLRLHKNLLSKMVSVSGTEGIQFTYDNGTISLSVV